MSRSWEVSSSVTLLSVCERTCSAVLRTQIFNLMKESGDLPQAKTHPVHMFVVESVVEVGEL